MLWLLATAKLNQSERFGVGLGELYGRGEDRFDVQPERLYVRLQEHYHTRILADVVSMFELPFPTVPPPPRVRGTIRAIVALPYAWTLPLVGASEMLGCVLFRAMRDLGVALFADDPPVAARIGGLYDEILADEIGHVGFVAAMLSPRRRRLTRFLARHVVWRGLLPSFPELVEVVGRDALRARLSASFDVGALASEFPGRAYAAARM
jgi:glycosyltransferase involved in cell wall biosynthesis